MNQHSITKEVEFFLAKLAIYKRLIDKDIAAYSKELKKSTLQNYGSYARITTDAFLEILARGGKRIRGTLAMVGYEMMGGTNQPMIIAAARAIEMIHAYLLIMDDIQDRSMARRGGPTVHAALADYHLKKHLAGNADHFGVSIALNAMGVGNHAAQIILANLDVPMIRRIKALRIFNQSIIITAYGQTNDIFNEVSGPVGMRDIENVLEWKTAHYTFLNPLAFGMILAGANDDQTKAIRGYAINAGRAFQITDDILSTFGTEFESGKSPLDDIKEGKRTVLTLYALEHADRADKNFLIQMLGNQNITQTEFQRCKDILIETGALEFAIEKAKRCVHSAIESLTRHNSNFDNKIDNKSIEFLIGLAQYLLNRKA